MRLLMPLIVLLCGTLAGPVAAQPEGESAPAIPSDTVTATYNATLEPASQDLFTAIDGRVVYRHYNLKLALPAAAIPGRSLVLPVRISKVSPGQRFTITGHLPGLGGEARYLTIQGLGDHPEVAATDHSIWVSFESMGGDMVNSSMGYLDFGTMEDYHFTGDLDFTVQLEVDAWGAVWSDTVEGLPAATADLLFLLIISTDPIAGNETSNGIGLNFPSSRELMLKPPERDAVMALLKVTVPTVLLSPGISETQAVWGLEGELGIDIEDELLSRAYPGWARTEPIPYRGQDPSGAGARLFQLTHLSEPARWAVTQMVCPTGEDCYYSLTDYAAPAWAPEDRD